MSGDRFRFRKHDSIGAAAAEEDSAFLAECFIDNGDLTPLLDCGDRRRIILGRTGTGKSALLKRLVSDTDAIVINPETLSFNYLTNSTILQFFLEAGVKLDLFFKLLWRHVFTVELIKARYDLKTQRDAKSFLERIKTILARDRNKERAIQYLLQWGDQFWENTEYRIKEITQRIENELKASVAGKFPIAELHAGGASKLAEEDKIEIVQRGKTVINAIQMRELTDVLVFLNDDLFADEMRPYYICIDRLDENWVDEKFRYLLIRSLIETVRDFLQVRNVKIIAALRTDLIERVFRFTRDPGFQEEKYRSLYLQLRWTEGQLVELLDRRINALVKRTYTKEPVWCRDLFPCRVGKAQATSYLVSRTLMRPRDLIEFVNNILENAAGRATITQDMILHGEGVYSKNRMRSLQDEWIADHPALIEFTSLLKQRPKTFRLDTVPREEIEEFCLEYTVKNFGATDFLSTQARAVADGMLPWSNFLCSLMHVFYLTGILALKSEAYEAYQWSHQGSATVVADTIDIETSIAIHPMFYRFLGIKP